MNKIHFNHLIQFIYTCLALNSRAVFVSFFFTQISLKMFRCETISIPISSLENSDKHESNVNRKQQVKKTTLEQKKKMQIRLDCVEENRKNYK